MRALRMLDAGWLEAGFCVCGVWGGGCCWAERQI